MLDGTQSDENGDYAAGSVVFNPVGSEHSVWTREGCVVLIQWNLPVDHSRERHMSDITFDIASLHAAYADGPVAADMVATVFARIAAADDPGIFIHLASGPTWWRRRMRSAPSIPRPSRSGAFPSR